jgi:hypothetical protein
MYIFCLRLMFNDNVYDYALRLKKVFKVLSKEDNV